MRVSREMMAWPIALGLLLAPASLLQSAALGAEAGSPQFFQIFAMGSAAEQNSIELVPELQKNADQGDSNAEYKLGLVYDAGVGARQDLAKAALWYQKAADQGHVAAQFNLGLHVRDRSRCTAGFGASPHVAEPRSRGVSGGGARRA